MEDLKLQPGEHILVAARKHWLVYVGGAIPYAVFAYLPVLILNFIGGSDIFANAPWIDMISTENPWVAFVLGVYWLFVWMAAFSDFMRYFLDIWIITNKRIIDVEQHNFFDREVTSLFLDRVEDVTMEQIGFFHTLLGFGTVTAQSAGATEKITLPGIGSPKHIRDVLMEHVAKFEDRPEHVIVDKK